MSYSKEHLIADNLYRLLRTDNIGESFTLFNELYNMIDGEDLQGIEIYLWLERADEAMLNFAPSMLLNILHEMFLQYSVYYVNRFCNEFGYSRYECWQRFSKVVYCLQPVVFHYVHDKEFFKHWNNSKNDWE